MGEGKKGSCAVLESVLGWRKDEFFPLRATQHISKASTTAAVIDAVGGKVSFASVGYLESIRYAYAYDDTIPGIPTNTSTTKSAPDLSKPLVRCFLINPLALEEVNDILVSERISADGFRTGVRISPEQFQSIARRLKKMGMRGYVGLCVCACISVPHSRR